MKRKTFIILIFAIIIIGLFVVHPKVTSPAENAVLPLNSAYAIRCIPPICGYSPNLNFTLYKKNSDDTFSRVGKMLFLQGFVPLHGGGLTWEGDIDFYGKKAAPGIYKFSFVRYVKIGSMSFPIQFGKSKNFRIADTDVIGVNLKANGNSEKEVEVKKGTDLNLEWEINASTEIQCLRFASGTKADYNEDSIEGAGGGKTIPAKSGGMKIIIPDNYIAVTYRIDCFVKEGRISDFIIIKVI